MYVGAVHVHVCGCSTCMWVHYMYMGIAHVRGCSNMYMYVGAVHMYMHVGAVHVRGCITCTWVQYMYMGIAHVRGCSTCTCARHCSSRSHFLQAFASCPDKKHT